ncbi:MAG: UDP-N-acetylglucosamine 1-carboxyvinyltransferase [Rickettsiales bacterium]|nr:MAG: UDP-N-acetylglucosamine 1-carboxyvinyltransferase [Rickettsiales bacterium]
MDKFIIKGGKPLEGTIEISGAKNSILALMLCSILTDEDIILDNVPYLTDVVTMYELLKNFGINIVAKNNNIEENIKASLADKLQLKLNSSNIRNFHAPYDIAKKMRASFWVLGPLLARFGQAEVSLPGGCAIGTRQIDLHLDTLRLMGADLIIKDGYITGSVKGKFKAIHYTFDKVSVGATINAIMSACLADGESVFINCAHEPEIVDLCHLLVKMGAHIEGIGTSRVVINGVNKLTGAVHQTIPDRIEIGTYIAAVGLTSGKITLNNVDHNIIENLNDKFTEAGLKIIKSSDHSITITSDGIIKPVNIQTMPYPGFPTDMQAQFMALMCVADGVSSIAENMFENRFMHIPELQRMGADISICHNLATVKGIPKFKGANVMATDLRASVCLVLAGLASEGTTIIDRIYHIDRGYCRIEKKLSGCGAIIERVSA